MCASAVEKAWPLSLWRRCLHGARRFGEAPSGRRTADGRRGLLLGSGLLPAWWSKIQQGRKGKGSKGQPCLAATEKTQGILAILLGLKKKKLDSSSQLLYCTESDSVCVPPIWNRWLAKTKTSHIWTAPL
jgi:hypothetical protein